MDAIPKAAQLRLLPNRDPRGGDPLFIIQHDVDRWRKFRCATCAGEPVPELPAIHEATVSQPARLRPIAELAEDWKLKAGGS